MRLHILLVYEVVNEAIVLLIGVLTREYAVQVITFGGAHIGTTII